MRRRKTIAAQSGTETDDYDSAQETKRSRLMRRSRPAPSATPPPIPRPSSIRRTAVANSSSGIRQQPLAEPDSIQSGSDILMQISPARRLILDTDTDELTADDEDRGSFTSLELDDDDDGGDDDDEGEEEDNVSEESEEDEIDESVDEAEEEDEEILPVRRRVRTTLPTDIGEPDETVRKTTRKATEKAKSSRRKRFGGDVDDELGGNEAEAEEEDEQITAAQLEKVKRQREQAEQRREKEKADTVQKLLYQQTGKRSKQKPEETAESRRAALFEKLLPAKQRIRYIQRPQSSVLIFPPDYQIPIVPPNNSTTPRAGQKCQYLGCQQPKKYLDPRSMKRSCGLEHYRALSSVGTSKQ